MGWRFFNEYSYARSARSCLAQFVPSGSSEQNVGSDDVMFQELYSEDKPSSCRAVHCTVSSGWNGFILTSQLTAVVRQVGTVTPLLTEIIWQSCFLERTKSCQLEGTPFETVPNIYVPLCGYFRSLGSGYSLRGRTWQTGWSAALNARNHLHGTINLHPSSSTRKARRKLITDGFPVFRSFKPTDATRN